MTCSPYLFYIAFVLCCESIFAVQIVQTCDLEDNICSTTLLTQLYGCPVQLASNKPYTINNITIPYPLFNVTAFIDNACITGLYDGKVIKLVYDYKRNQTLLVVSFNKFLINGTGFFRFARDQQFDVNIYSDYILQYFTTSVTAVLQGTNATSCDLRNNRRLCGEVLTVPTVSSEDLTKSDSLFNVETKTPLITIGQSILTAARTDPQIYASIVKVRDEPVIWIKEQVYVLAKYFLDGFLDSYSCNGYSEPESVLERPPTKPREPKQPENVDDEDC